MIRTQIVSLVLLATTAQAADEVTCAAYAVKVERLVKLLTNDEDVAQAANERARVYCGVIDEPIKLVLDAEQGTTPAIVKPTPWELACRARFRSFRVSDGTVIPAGRHKRVRCPIPSG